MIDLELEAEALAPRAFTQSLEADWDACRPALAERLGGAVVLVVGGAGTIGSACLQALIGLAPRRIDVIDVDENGLARLARDIRGRYLGELATQLRFLPLDFGAWPALACVRQGGPYDLVLNLAAVKHVRSQKTLFTLLHMIDTNVVKQHRFLDAIRRDGLAARYFAVSTDKAADPASFMGATKRLLEMVLGAADPPPACSAARFANVAYSSGSLLESFVLRLAAGQPIAVPRDTRRYFITGPQAARICLLAAQTCPPGVVAIPAFASGADALDLGEIAARFLHRHGLKAAFVDSVEAAEAMLATAKAVRSAYPVVVMPRDTAGEKEVEVFHGSAEARIDIGLGALEGLAPQPCDPAALRETLAALAEQVAGSGVPLDMPGLCRLMQRAVPNFRHADSDLSLDDRL